MKTYFKKRWYFFIPLIIAGIAAFGYITMSLWNYLMPAIFNLPEITYWQTLGLLVLSRIFFGCGPRPGRRGHHPWSGHIREKLAKMTPEEREAYYQKWNSKCYPGYRRDTATEQ